MKIVIIIILKKQFLIFFSNLGLNPIFLFQEVPVGGNATNLTVLNKLVELYDDVFAHDGYGEIRVEIRIQRRGQKEVILHCGKQHRWVVDYESQSAAKNRYRHQVVPRKAWHGSNSNYVGVSRRESGRRSGCDRRTLSAKRDFRLERRITATRRIHGDRRVSEETANEKPGEKSNERRRGAAL